MVEIHLEHAAREARVDGALVATDKPEWRWWFTSFIPPLEGSWRTRSAARTSKRSLIMPPEGFPPGSEHRRRTPRSSQITPIVSFLTAPVYLFDAADTIEMVHEPSLVPPADARAAVRIIEGLRGQTAAGLRADLRSAACRADRAVRRATTHRQALSPEDSR